MVGKTLKFIISENGNNYPFLGRICRFTVYTECKSDYLNYGIATLHKSVNNYGPMLIRMGE